MTLSVSEDRLIDLLVKTVVYVLSAFALINVLAAAWDEYTGVVYWDFSDLSGSPPVAVREMDPEGFRNRVAVKLIPSIFAIGTALYFKARMKIFIATDPCSPDFGGSKDVWGHEDEKNWETKE